MTMQLPASLSLPSAERRSEKTIRDRHVTRVVRYRRQLRPAVLGQVREKETQRFPDATKRPLDRQSTCHLARIGHHSHPQTVQTTNAAFDLLKAPSTKCQRPQQPWHCFR